MAPSRMTAGQRRALAEFLRARRRRLTPADVDLPAGGVRRTAGLRREEVAVLAGVSVTWYTWLEQGRQINPSEEVLRAIARTLRLNEDETRHLLELARPEQAPPSTADTPPALQDLVDSQYPAPAVLVDRRWDLVAWNDSAEALWSYSSVPPADRNLAWLTFHPYIRARLVDWEAHARRVVAEVRASSVALAHDRRFAEVLDRLRSTFPEVDRWWSAGEVRTRTGARKVYDHPATGRLVLDEVILRPAAAADLQLVVLVPARDTDTAERLANLVPGARGATTPVSRIRS